MVDVGVTDAGWGRAQLRGGLMITPRMFVLMDLRDRDLLERWTLRDETGSAHRWSWIVVTHAGGAAATIASVALPLIALPGLRGGRPNERPDIVEIGSAYFVP